MCTFHSEELRFPYWTRVKIELTINQNSVWKWFLTQGNFLSGRKFKWKGLVFAGDFRPFFAGTVRRYCSLRYQCCRCMWCYTVGLPGFTLSAGDMNHNHLKKIKVCFNVTSFAWSNYHRITWTLRGSDKSRHRHRSSLISFFIVGGWKTVFFLNYRGCVCLLGITTQKPGLLYLSQLSHLQNLPDDRCLQRSHAYHRGLMGPKFRWRFGGRNMGETWDTHGF